MARRRSRRRSRRSRSTSRRSYRKSRRSARRGRKSRSRSRSRSRKGRRKSRRSARRNPRRSRKARRNPSRKRYSKRRNPSRSRSRKARRNPRRSRSRRRNPGRKYGRRSRRSNPGIVRSIKSSVRGLTKPRSLQATVTDGFQLSVGYAGVNALRALEGRFGIDGVMASVPGGAARTIAEYALKVINIGLAASFAGMIGGKMSKNVRAGGMANFGVTLLSDLSTLAGPSGGTIRSYLSGVGDYNLAYGMGTAMHPAAPSLGNYNLVGGSQAMAPTSGYDVYAPLEGVYG
jgi:hypothetical protein